MKTEDIYLKFVRWSEQDKIYVGYCPDLFPWGGICHSDTEEKAYAEVCAIVRQEIDDLQREGKELPSSITRPMRDVEFAA